MSASSGVKHNGLRLKILQSYGAIACLPETIAVREESVLSTEIQKYLLHRALPGNFETLEPLVCSVGLHGFLVSG